MRQIPVGELSRCRLAAYIETYRKDDAPSDPVFVSLSCHNRGQALSAHGLGQLFEVLVKKAGIDSFRASPHDLRHYFSVSYLKSGGQMYHLSRLLGHSSVSVTERYCESLGLHDVRPLVEAHMR